MKQAMNKYSFAALAAAAVVGLGATAVVAQQQIPPPPFAQQPNTGMGGMGGMGMPMGPGGMRMGGYGQMARMSPEDRQAFFNAKIAAVRAGLALTPEQEKLWPQAENAVREMAAGMMARRDAMQKKREEIRASGKAPDPIEMMRLRADASIARGEAMKKVLDGVSPLYATLSPEQKSRLGHIAGRRFKHEMRGWGDEMRGMDRGWGHHHRGWWRG